MPPKRRQRKRIPDKQAIQPPIPVSNAKREEIIDNTTKTIKRAPASYSTKHSNFLITFNPNSSVSPDINPKMFKQLKEEVSAFASYVLDPKNAVHILKCVNDDKDFLSKIIGYGEDKVASIEYSQTSNKRLHTHIYLPITHRTKIQLNVDNLRKIADIMLKPLGIEGSHLDCKVERSNAVYSARDYVLKMADEGEIVK